MSCIDRNTFNSNLTEISQIAEKLNDNWKLIKATNNNSLSILYLEKQEQVIKKDDNTLLTFIYHIVYSESFQVPVFYLNAYKSNGSPLPYPDIYKHFKLDTSNSLMVLSQQEHPILFKPFYFLHPCKTAEWMSTTNSTSNINNYTLRWLSFVSFTLNISFDYLKYIQ
jgi:ubiquitin-like-conjugating enzyme ATG10